MGLGLWGGQDQRRSRVSEAEEQVLELGQDMWVGIWSGTGQALSLAWQERPAGLRLQSQPSTPPSPSSRLYPIFRLMEAKVQRTEKQSYEWESLLQLQEARVRHSSRLSGEWRAYLRLQEAQVYRTSRRLHGEWGCALYLPG